MTELRFCEGCGSALQTEDPKKTGYIPTSSLKKESLICQRCFRIKHYNEVQKVQINENDFLQILHTISQTNSLVINVVDLFDIDGTLINGLHRFIGKNPFIMIANKIDLFPKGINKAKIKNWLINYTREHGLYPEEIFFISAEREIGLKEVVDYIQSETNKKNIYLTGATNVGKSSLINRLLNYLNGDKQIELTTSMYPGTTLSTVEIPIINGKKIIDTPGIVNYNRLSEVVSPETLKIISPRKTLKPKIYQLNGRQSLFWGGLARIDQKSTTQNSFICYIANELTIHRTKLEKAEELYQNHLGGLLSPPSLKEAENLPELRKHSFKTNSNEKTDIVISGLGWLTVTGEAANVDVYVPKGIGVHMRKALLS